MKENATKGSNINYTVVALGQAPIATTDLHLPQLHLQPGCQEDENMHGFIRCSGAPVEKWRR